MAQAEEQPGYLIDNRAFLEASMSAASLEMQ